MPYTTHFRAKAKNMHRQITVRILPLLVLVALVAGCGGGGSSNSGVPTGNAKFSIVVTPASSSVTIGGTRHFSASAVDANGNVVTGISFTWHSSNTAIAVSKGGGNFLGIASGAVTVTATAISSSNSGQTITTVTSNLATLTVIADAVGTAAEGAPILGGEVSLSDAHGQIASGGTDMAGRFDIPVQGLSAPFLLKVEDAEGRILYGIAGAAGTANIDPYTDLLVREWYALRGSDPAGAFGTEAPLPGAADLKALDRMFTDLLSPALEREGLDAGHFSVLSSPFAADHTGFDHILDNSRIDAARGRVRIEMPDGAETTDITLDRESGALRWTLRMPLPGGALSTNHSLTLPGSR